MKMRKKLTLGMIAIYLFSIIGIAVTMHFMGDRLSDKYIMELSRKEVSKSVDSLSVNSVVDKAKSSEIKMVKSEVSTIETLLGPLVSEVFKDLLPRIFSKI